MFGIGPTELLVIAFFIVIFVGPKRLPEVMKQFGRFVVQARRYSGEAKQAMQELLREAELEIQKEEAEKLRKQFDIAGHVKEALKEEVTYDINQEGHPEPATSDPFAAHQPTAPAPAPDTKTEPKA